MSRFPDEAKLMLPGFSLASLIRSATEFTGSAGLTTRTLGTPATSTIGTKSLMWSYGIFEYKLGLMACVPTVPMSSVYPSGGLLATRSEPMLPPAPGRLSTTTDWPSDSVSLCAAARASMSVVPAGRKRNDQLDRPIRIVLREGAERKAGEQGAKRPSRQATHHFSPLSLAVALSICVAIRFPGRCQSEIQPAVIPAKAGIQRRWAVESCDERHWDPRFRGDDGVDGHR